MAASSPELVRAQGLTKIFAAETGAIPALRSIELSLEKGDTLAVVGPSGCGKSTLLLLLAGLESPTSGKVLFQGQPLTRPHREIALVLQDYGLFPWKTVRKNVELGLRIRGEEIVPHRVDDLLNELEIGTKTDLYPQQLSGGQKQRVALARALILNPHLLLLDEPFAALDTLTRERLQDLVADAWRRRKFGMVVVTHNIEEAVVLGKRIAVMGGTPGRVLALIENPQACSFDFRRSEGFYPLVKRLRRELEAAG